MVQYYYCTQQPQMSLSKPNMETTLTLCNIYPGDITTKGLKGQTQKYKFGLPFSKTNMHMLGVQSYEFLFFFFGKPTNLALLLNSIYSNNAKLKTTQNSTLTTIYPITSYTKLKTKVGTKLK